MASTEQLLRQPGTALLWGSWREAPEVLLLREPCRVLVATEAAEIPELLAQAEREAQAGQYVAGYLAYEAGAAFGLPTHAPSDLTPLAWLGCYPPEHVQRLAPGDLYPLAQAPSPADAELEMTPGPQQYAEAIATIKHYLAAGDSYQVNYTCRARLRAEGDPLAWFVALVRAHPVPYAAYLNLGEAQVLSLSPELLLRRRGELLESRPMKGTRPRGADPQEDAALARELGESLKDRAENLMIVDMVRNDLGRVARCGSVQVPTLFSAERYRSVWQMTSTVCAELEPGTPLTEIMAAVFPGASVTGAPKRRTMEIIRELEPEPRGVYCGALGLLQPGGDFAFNLPIRTLVCREGACHLGIGAGIIWDSDTGAEYEETLLKASFALRPVADLRLWETLLLTAEGEFTYREPHLARLARSAEYWDFPRDRERVESALDGFAREASGTSLAVRLELDQAGEVRLTPRPAPPPPEGKVRVRLAEARTQSGDRFLRHKTSQRPLYDQERNRALGEGYFEVLFLNEQDHLTEGAITNLFLRLEDGWYTPPVTEGLLPGLWREDFLAAMGARERPLSLDDLLQARRVVIGNSVRGAVEVDEVCDAEGQVRWTRP